MKSWSIVIQLVAVIAALPALAVDYKVNRSWTDGTGTASLTGTLSLPAGTYNIRNGTPNPFTGINLTLTVNGASTLLDAADVSVVQGDGKFDVVATASSLTFAAVGDGFNPADVVFANSISNNNYSIGMDDGGTYELGFVAPQLVFVPRPFPTVFGVVPEPSCAAITCLVGGAAATLRRRRSPRGRCA